MTSDRSTTSPKGASNPGTSSSATRGSTTTADATTVGKRLGRPPRITPAQIAEAALAIGLDQATIRNVADRLGMSVPGLYRHVRTREELLAMAAAHGLGEVPLPEDHGQPWTEWLLEYGRFVFDALVAQPEIVGQILAGTYNSIRLAQHLEAIFTVLTARGFTVDEADLARRRLIDAVNGAAVAEIGRRATLEDGHPRLADLRRAVQALGPTTVPLLAELVSDADSRDESDPFDTVHLVVAAMAASRSTSASLWSGWQDLAPATEPPDTSTQEA